MDTFDALWQLEQAKTVSPELLANLDCIRPLPECLELPPPALPVIHQNAASSISSFRPTIYLDTKDQVSNPEEFMYNEEWRAHMKCWLGGSCKTPAPLPPRPTEELTDEHSIPTPSFDAWAKTAVPSESDEEIFKEFQQQHVSSSQVRSQSVSSRKESK